LLRVAKLRGQEGFNRLLEHLKGLCADNTLTIEDEGRRALHTQGLCPGGFLLDNSGVFARVQAFVERLCIQAQLNGKGFQIVLVERAPVFSVLAVEEKIMIFPKRILIGGTFAGLARPLGFRP